MNTEKWRDSDWFFILDLELPQCWFPSLPTFPHQASPALGESARSALLQGFCWQVLLGTSLFWHSSFHRPCLWFLLPWPPALPHWGKIPSGIAERPVPLWKHPKVESKWITVRGSFKLVNWASSPSEFAEPSGTWDFKRHLFYMIKPTF